MTAVPPAALQPRRCRGGVVGAWDVGQLLGLRLLQVQEGRAVEEELLLALAQLDAADARDADDAATLGT